MNRLPGWISDQESTCQCRRLGFDPWGGKIPWRRKWQPTPVFLPGESHGQRSLVGYSSWGHRSCGVTTLPTLLQALGASPPDEGALCWWPRAKQLILEGTSSTLHAHPGPGGDTQGMSKCANHSEPHRARPWADAPALVHTCLQLFRLLIWEGTTGHDWRNCRFQGSGPSD